MRQHGLKLEYVLVISRDVAKVLFAPINKKKATEFEVKNRRKSAKEAKAEN